MTKYTHVLLAVDFMPEAEIVGARAAELARRYDATLSMVHVVEPVVMAPPYEMMPVLPEGVEQELEASARDALGRLGDKLDIPEDGRHVLTGPVKSEILRFTEDNGVDLIVLGSHGRHGLQLLLGSTANAVLHGAPCDVLAVRVGEAAEAE